MTFRWSKVRRSCRSLLLRASSSTKAPLLDHPWFIIRRMNAFDGIALTSAGALPNSLVRREARCSLLTG